MAVVFISPKQRQRAFFLVITIAFLLFLAIVSFGVFLAKPKEAETVLVFNKPKVRIDMKIFDSDQFKKLQQFNRMDIQFTYTATSKDGKIQKGFISAESIEKARTSLEGAGLTVSDIKEAEIGRDNPFEPYYQVTVAPTTTTTTPKK